MDEAVPRRKPSARDRLIHVATLAGWVVAAGGGVLGWWSASGSRPPVPVVAMVLVAAAPAVAFAGRTVRWPVWVAAGVAALTLVSAILQGPTVAGQLIGRSGLGVAVGRWGLVVGATVALVAAGYTTRHQRAAPAAPPGNQSRRRGRQQDREPTWRPVLVLLGLCAVGAELLAAYSDSTGRPAELAFAVVFFAALYGAPALVMRDAVRRAGLGWPSLLLIATALGLLEAGVIDQSLFNESYGDYEGWEDGYRAGRIPWLGISAYQAQSFVLGHVIFSFCAPIAVAEALWPQLARRPWLRAGGLVTALLCYGGAAALIVTDTVANEDDLASWPELAGALVLVLALVTAALLLPKPPRRGQRPTPHLLGLVAASLVLVTLLVAVPESLAGAAIAVGIAAAIAGLLLVAARSTAWGLAPVAAIASGALLSRALLAFTYFPLVGETGAVRKYSHNAAMLALVLTVSWLALRRAEPRSTPRLAGPGEQH